MRSLFHFIAAASFCLHVLLGCCVHHAHGCDWKFVWQVTGDESHKCCREQAHEHDDESRDSHDHERHRDGDGCDETACHFLKPTDTVWHFDSAAEQATQFVAMIVPDHQPTARDYWRMEVGDDRCPPVRLHILNQVLLA